MHNFTEQSFSEKNELKRWKIKMNKILFLNDLKKWTKWVVHKQRTNENAERAYFVLHSSSITFILCLTFILHIFEPLSEDIKKYWLHDCWWLPAGFTYPSPLWTILCTKSYLPYGLLILYILSNERCKLQIPSVK